MTLNNVTDIVNNCDIISWSRQSLEEGVEPSGPAGFVPVHLRGSPHTRLIQSRRHQMPWKCQSRSVKTQQARGEGAQSGGFNPQRWIKQSCATSCEGWKLAGALPRRRIVQGNNVYLIFFLNLLIVLLVAEQSSIKKECSYLSTRGRYIAASLLSYLGR